MHRNSIWKCICYFMIRISSLISTNLLLMYFKSIEWILDTGTVEINMYIVVYCLSKMSAYKSNHYFWASGKLMRNWNVIKQVDFFCKCGFCDNWPKNNYVNSAQTYSIGEYYNCYSNIVATVLVVSPALLSLMVLGFLKFISASTQRWNLCGFLHQMAY